ncbi:MAG: hypothetical protein ACO3JL_08480, partial [Myxococcota bacterium]
IVVEADEGGSPAVASVDTEAVVERLQHDESLTPRQRAKQLAKALGISPRDAYARILAGSREPEPSGIRGPRSGPAKADLSSEAHHPVRPPLVQSPALRDLQGLLVEAVEAFCVADAASAKARGGDVPEDSPVAVEGQVGTGIRGADELLQWLKGRPGLPAPVEAAGLARALLGALVALDALDDALDHGADTRDEPALPGR